MDDSKESKRLTTFVLLAEGISVDDGTSSHSKILPHILGQKAPDLTEPSCCSRESYRCWKALLGFHGANEWDVVREHFEKSRSMKVLSIIQQ